MTEKIVSKDNQKYKLVKSLLQKKNRTKNRLYTVEGIKSVKDAVAVNADIEMMFMSQSFYESDAYIKFYDYECFVVSDSLFAALCDTKTPQGILAVVRMNSYKDFVPDTDKMYIYCDKISDPGNLGTIIRTADAAGFGAVLLSSDSADLYSPKTIRSSMGSFFHIPVYEDIDEQYILRIKKFGFKFFCGALGNNCIPYTNCNFKVPCVIAVGNEAKGISAQILKLADECVKIPILGAAESLNAGVAAAVLMYEALKQRSEKKFVD